jgi:hypothetical protein
VKTRAAKVDGGLFDLMGLVDDSGPDAVHHDPFLRPCVDRNVYTGVADSVFRGALAWEKDFVNWSLLREEGGD